MTAGQGLRTGAESTNCNGILSVRVDEKHFVVRGSFLRVLENLAFSVAAGEFLSLLGPSGCGKTTLLRLIGGLDADYTGQVSLNGTVIRAPSPDVGIVFQESRLLPWLTVERNLAFALPPQTGKREARQKVEQALQRVGLLQFRDAWPYQLSGGMEKRVALARALVNLPRLLLLDEPFSALDAFTKMALQEELDRIYQEERITTILVTHDVEEAAYLSDRVALLTSSPAKIRSMHTVPLPRPRCRTSEVFASIRGCILTDALGGSEWSTHELGLG